MSLSYEIEEFGRGFVIANEKEYIFASDREHIVKRTLGKRSLEEFVLSFTSFKNLVVRSYPLGENSAVIIVGEMNHTTEEAKLLLTLIKNMSIKQDNESISALVGVPEDIVVNLEPLKGDILEKKIKNLNEVQIPEEKKFAVVRKPRNKILPVIGGSIASAIVVAILIPFVIFPVADVINIDNDYQVFASGFQIDNSLHTRGDEFYLQGDYHKALDWYEEELEKDPGNIVILNNRSTTLSKMGDYEEAIVGYDEVLKVEPNHVTALNNKGLALYQLEQYEEAIELYERALEIKPNYQDAKINKELANLEIKRLNDHNN